MDSNNNTQQRKVFFITGISTGLGRSIVESALNAGHYVIGTTRNGTVPYNQHSNLTVLPLSFNNLHHVKNIIDQAYNIYNRIDVVINNAGYGLDGAAVEEYSLEQGKELYDANVWGTVAVIQAILPYMRKQGNGHIINIGSVRGVVSLPGFSLYCSSKFTIEAFSESLAAEVKEFGIHVNIMQPGAFKTSFVGNVTTPDQPLDVYQKYRNLVSRHITQSTMGDVVKVGDAILHITNNVSTLPLRIPLGSDSVGWIRGKVTAQLDDLKKVESLAASTDLATNTVDSIIDINNNDSQPKVFFITGISTGLGRSIVASALNAGHYVIGTTRSGSIPYQQHSNLTVLPLSFNDLHHVKSAIGQAYNIHNRIDVVINNAGYGIEGAIEEWSIDQAKELYNVNVWGTVAVIQAALPYLRQQANGHIINVTGGSGVVSFPGVSLYCSTKFAVEGISESLAAEMKEFGIHVTIAQPGSFKTSFTGNTVQPDRQLDIYQKYRDLIAKFQDELSIGDVKRVGQLILHITNNVNTLPLRIPLGSDCVGYIRQKLVAQLDDLKKVESLSASTDSTVVTRV